MLLADYRSIAEPDRARTDAPVRNDGRRCLRDRIDATSSRPREFSRPRPGGRAHLPARIQLIEVSAAPYTRCGELANVMKRLLVDLDKRSALPLDLVELSNLD